MIGTNRLVTAAILGLLLLLAGTAEPQSRRRKSRSAKPDDGWTKLIPSRDSRAVYVSSSLGNDSGNGRDPRRPVATLGRAKQLLRNGHPDWMLLKAGDVWNSSIGGWGLSGRSALEPMVVTAYGKGARPLLRGSRKPGITRSGADSDKPNNFLRFVGLDFIDPTRDPEAPEYKPPAPPSAGFSWTGGGEDILIEDCRFRFFSGGIVLQQYDNQALRNVRIRRCIVTDSYKPSGHSQGIYASGVEGLLIEENVVDHNGWHPTVPGARRTMFNHNLYIQTSCSDVIVRGNIVARGASNGLQLRSGGECRDNLFIRNAIAMFAAGESAEVLENVVIGSDDISPKDLRGWGIEMHRHAKGGRYAGNLVLHRRSDNSMPGMFMDVPPQPEFLPDRIENNVVQGWSDRSGNGIRVKDPGRKDVILSGNIVDGRTLEGLRVRFRDPRRSLEMYLARHRKSGGFEELLKTVRCRARGTWDPDWSASGINRFLREGFTPVGRR